MSLLLHICTYRLHTELHDVSFMLHALASGRSQRDGAFQRVARLRHMRSGKAARDSAQPCSPDPDAATPR